MADELTPAEQAVYDALASGFHHAERNRSLFNCARVAVAAAKPHIEAEALRREADLLHELPECHGDVGFCPCTGCEWFAKLHHRAHQIRVMVERGGSDAR